MWRLNQPHRGYSQSENANVQTSVAKILVKSGMNTSLFLPLSYRYSGVLSLFPALVCYLHNCLSPPLAGGGERHALNVKVLILIDGVGGWMVPEHRASPHRHDKFQGTKCNGLINPCWAKMEIWWINSWWGWNAIGPGSRGVHYLLFDCMETRRWWQSGTSQLWLPNSGWRRSCWFWNLTNDNVTTPSLHIIIINTFIFSRVITAQSQDIQIIII